MKIFYIKHYEKTKLPEKAIALSLKTAKSEEEIKLALELAKRAHEKGYNIAKKFELEVILWLAGKTDIESALESSAPKIGDPAIIVVLGNQKIPGAKKAKLRKKATPLELERISLSRIKN